jgi:glycosyltransferase involved in cell wall biosynthesis
MKKILLITDNYPVHGVPSSTGWLANYVSSLAMTTEVDVLSIVKIIPRFKTIFQLRNTLEWFIRISRIMTISESTNQRIYRKIVFTVPDSLNWRLNPWLILLQAEKIGVSLCKVKSYDAILVHWTHPCGELGLQLGKKFSIPVFIADNNGLELYRRYFNGLGFPVNKAILESSSCIITQCTSQSILLRQELPHKKIRQISLGISMDAVIERKNHGGQTVRIITIARLDDALKNIDKVIESLSSLPANYHLTIVGSGFFEKSLHRLTNTLELSSRIRFTGWINNDKIDEFLREHDIFVLPSDYETFGLVYLEAVKAGLPVVSTNVGVISDFRSTLAGVFVLASALPDEIARGIKDAAKILNNREEWHKNNISVLRDEYSWENHATKYRDLFSDYIP